MVDLFALLVLVTVELEASSRPEERALLRRLREGTFTPRDASNVADMIESLVEGAGKQEKNN